MPKRLFNVRDLWTGRPIKPPNNKILQLNQLQSHIVESNALKLFNKNTEVTVTSRTSFQSNSLNIAEVTHPFPRVPSAPAPVEESGHLMFGKAERWLEIVYMSHKQSGWRERLYNFFHFQSGVWKQRAGASVTSGTTTRHFFYSQVVSYHHVFMPLTCSETKAWMYIVPDKSPAGLLSPSASCLPWMDFWPLPPTSLHITLSPKQLLFSIFIVILSNPDVYLIPKLI